MRRGFITVSLRTPIFSRRGRRRSLQPLGAQKENAKRVDGRLLQARSSGGGVGVGSGSHQGVQKQMCAEGG